MQNPRKQSSTAFPIQIKLVLATDGVTPATGKTVSVTVSQGGGVFAPAAGLVSEVGHGIYALAGHASDRNTIGPGMLVATATGCNTEHVPFHILAFDPFASPSPSIVIQQDEVQIQ